MKPPLPLRALFALTASAALASGAQAAVFTLSGQARHHNDHIVIDISVAAGSQVSLWTDSWLSGLNFDPQLFLARAGVILQGDDDGGSLIHPGAGFYDAGLQFTATTAGSYRLVLNASSNDALGNTLGDGFAYDGQAPIALADWNQPGYDINANDQKGGFWRLTLSGVEQASVVPEPATWALWLPALLGLGLASRRRRLKGCTMGLPAAQAGASNCSSRCSRSP